ncbi:MAG: cysteine peptidase family C39 domain-containing protein [Planctomycetota bacterium]|nr:cysteine peptidase family C39 domain-containing protein [Planctomycetota bacterium]
MAPIKYSIWFDHMVVVMAVDEKGIWIGDPLKGRVQMSEEALKERWLGRTITID